MKPTPTPPLPRTARIFFIIGSVLLLVMAAFHGSGFFYVREAMSQSNAEAFLKDIVPALFAHPSIHLIGLSALGFLTPYFHHQAYRAAWLLAVLILLDGALAFYLGGIIPGLLLCTAAAFFSWGGLQSRNMLT